MKVTDHKAYKQLSTDPELFKFIDLEKVRGDVIRICENEPDSEKWIDLKDQYFSSLVEVESACRRSPNNLADKKTNPEMHRYLMVDSDELEECAINYLKNSAIQSDHIDYQIILHLVGHEFYAFLCKVTPKGLLSAILMPDKKENKAKAAALAELLTLAQSPGYSPKHLLERVKRAESESCVLKPVIVIIADRLIARKVDLLRA